MKRIQTNMNKLNRIFAMKQILLAVAMMFALPALILCQTNGKNTGKKGGDEQAVRQAINELLVALQKNDAAALDRLYADGYIFVGDNGTAMTKAQRIAGFKSGEIKYESLSLDVKTIHFFGNTAVAVLHFTGTFPPDVKIAAGKFVTAATYTKTKGRWQIVAAQSSRIVEQ